MTTLEEVEALTSPFDVDPRVITLRNGRWELDVLPATGGALAGGRIRTSDGIWRDLLRPTRPTAMGEAEKCSSFPMVPWSNRIRDGLLPFRGRTWQLQRNGADGTAIHGAARHSAWTVTDLTDTRVVLELDTTGLVGVNFPWRFRAQITYALSDNKLTVGTSVRNVDRRAVPGRLRAPPVPAAHAVAARHVRSRRPRVSPCSRSPRRRATRWSTPSRRAPPAPSRSAPTSASPAR